MELAILAGFVAFIARGCYLLGRMDERRAIRALASDALLDRQGNGKEGV